MEIGKSHFEIGKRTYVMGILNLTPDSFSDGGKWKGIEAAISHAKVMIQQGADIIDIGGESTRPNHVVVTEQEEISRVIPVIEALNKEIQVPISIDTYKGKVAELAIIAGASLINDIWGFKRDSYISKVAAKFQVPCCLMHNRDNIIYNDLMEDILRDLKESVEIAIKAGVKRENIILDPGIGFGKTYDQNLEVMQKLEYLNTLGCSILLGTSRKSMIGNTLNLPVEDRVEGTIATTVMGIVKGCDFVRVHDVLENKRACTMTDAIYRRNF
ncbi:MAG: dihydropteroate synthase [Clostridiaceae bacterium]|nr:dihydropteroate synthase [Clostridiaceae bacterium]